MNINLRDRYIQEEIKLFEYKEDIIKIEFMYKPEFVLKRIKTKVVINHDSFER